MLNTSEPKVTSEDDKKEWSTVHTRLGSVVKPQVQYINKYDSDGGEGALSAIHQKYYVPLCKLDDKETKNIEIAAVGSGPGGGFDHTSE